MTRDGGATWDWGRHGMGWEQQRMDVAARQSGHGWRARRRRGGQMAQLRRLLWTDGIMEATAMKESGKIFCKSWGGQRPFA
jgi:hypothetical protein